MSHISSTAQQNCKVVPKSASLARNRVTVLGQTYLAASNARTQAIITNTDLFIHNRIGEVIPPSSHRPDKHRNARILRKLRQILAQPDRLRVG